MLASLAKLRHCAGWEKAGGGRRMRSNGERSNQMNSRGIEKKKPGNAKQRLLLIERWTASQLNGVSKWVRHHMGQPE